MMNRIWILIMVLSVGFVSCTKDSAGDDPVTPVNPPTPPVTPTQVDSLTVDAKPTDWIVSVATDPTISMSITTMLSGDSVVGDYNTVWHFMPDENDLIASFVNGQCRGCTYPKLERGSYRAYITVQGADGDDPYATPPVTIQYYSTHYKHIFTVSDNINFKNGAILGTVDNPQKLVWKK